MRTLRDGAFHRFASPFCGSDKVQKKRKRKNKEKDSSEAHANSVRKKKSKKQNANDASKVRFISYDCGVVLLGEFEVGGARGRSMWAFRRVPQNGLK